MTDENPAVNSLLRRWALVSGLLGLGGLLLVIAARGRKPHPLSPSPYTERGGNADGDLLAGDGLVRTIDAVSLPEPHHMDDRRGDLLGRPYTDAVLPTTPARRGWALALAVLACGLLGVSAYYFSDSVALATLDNGMMYVLLGGLALGIAYGMHHPPVPLLRPAKENYPHPPTLQRTRHALSLQHGEGKNGVGMMYHAPTIHEQVWGGENALLPRSRTLLAGIGLLALLVGVNIGVLPPISAHIQMTLLVGGAWWVVRGMTPKPHPATLTPRPPLPQGEGEMRRRLRGWLLLAAIMLVALVVRLWDLENTLHIFMDEANFVDGINAVREGHTLYGEPVLILHPFGAVTAFPYTYPYLQHWSVQIFGPTLSALRLPSVIFGTLTIPALFLLAGALFDRKTAYLAAFALAVFPPHMHLSRLGMNNVADAFFGVLALALVARALRAATLTPMRADIRSASPPLQNDGEKGRGMMHHAPTKRAEIWGGDVAARSQRYWVLAGACLGFTQYFYEGGRLLFPALVIGWLILGALVGWIGRGQARGIVRMLASFALIALPYYLTQIGASLSLVPRLDDYGHDSSYLSQLLNSNGALATYWNNNLRPALLHFFYTPDSGQFFYGGKTALVLPFLVPAFLLGVFHALWRLKLPGMLLLLWLLLTALGNSLLQHSDWSARFVVAFPALALLIAVGARYTWGMIFESGQQSAVSSQLLAISQRPLARGQPPIPKSTVLIVYILLLAAVGLAQVTYYFGPHLEINNPQVRRFVYDFHDVMFRSRDLPAGSKVYLISDEEVWWPQIYAMQTFWRSDFTLDWWRPEEVQWQTLAALNPQTPVAFFVKPGDYETVSRLRERFTLSEPHMSPYNVPVKQQYVMYSVEW